MDPMCLKYPWPVIPLPEITKKTKILAHAKKKKFPDHTLLQFTSQNLTV